MSQLHQIGGCVNASRKADVVFVHGLGGDASATWRLGVDASSSWPHWLAEDFPNVGVWSLGFAASPSSWTRFLPGANRDAGHGMALPDRAGQLLDQMVLHGLGTRPLFFIGHSLGGLVIKQILRNAADDLTGRLHCVFDQTKVVLFLSTPHQGAVLASLAGAFRVVFGATVTIQDLKLHDAALRNLFNWYRNHSESVGIQTRCYFEQRGVKGLTIVNETSAHPGVGTDPVGLDEDHLSIAKPRNRNEQVCLAAAAMLREVLASPSKPKTTNMRVPAVTVNLDGSFAERLTHFPKPNEAPPRADQFFGRQAELSRLIQRLRDRQNTAVVGAAGMGKTALAAKALQEVVGETGTSLANSLYPDGVVFVDLYALQGSAEAFWNRLANKLAGPTFLENLPAQERAIAACHARAILVVIEGGEEAHGQNGHAPINELLAVLSPQNRRLLLTRLSTQAPLTEIVELKTALDAEDAGQLFDHITQSRVPLEVRTQALALLEGHPLAITWAANLLARDDDDPRSLLRDWSAQQLPSLSDPVEAEHTLEWLFDRSVRGLNVETRQVLDAAGLLAPRSFPPAALVSALGAMEEANKTPRLSLKELAHRSLLMKCGTGDEWQFTHVLAYRFARRQAGSGSPLLMGLAGWLHACFQVQLKAADLPLIYISLEHLAALLNADANHSLWEPLVYPAIYAYADRLEEMGNLFQLKLLLSAIDDWLQHLLPEIASESYWLRERSVLSDRLGNMLREQGDLAGALEAYREALAVSQRLAEADGTNAGWQRDLSVSFNNVGNVLREQGDLAGALRAYRRALAVSQRLAKADGTNAGWQRDLSVSQEKVGNVLREQGDLAGALEAYREALAVRQRLAEADGTNAGWQRDLSVSLNNVGNVLREQGDLAGALRAYREALAVSQRLAEADGTNAGWQRDLSVSLNNVGNVLQEQGDLTGALRAYRESLAVIQRLAEADGTNAGWQRDLSVSQDNVGNVLREQGDLAGALRAYREALAVRQRLAEADGTNAGWQRDLSVSQEKVGNVLQEQGDLAGALRAYREALAVRQRLAEADGTNAGWQRDLSVSFNNVGNVLQEQGDLAGALRAYRESLAVRQRLAEADGTNAGWQRDLSVSLNNVGNVLREQGDLAGALEAYREALAVRQRLAEADGTNAGWQRDLSVSFNNVGNVLREQGDLAGALEAYREALAVSQRLAEADGTNAGWQRDLSVSLNNVGNVLREQGDLAGALRAYREALAVRHRLAEADGTNAGWQRDLSVSQDNVGNVLREQGDLAGALRAYREARAVRQRLAKADGTNAGWQRDLSVSQEKVGNVLREQGDLAGALRAYREALAVSQRLAKTDGTNAGWQRDLSVSQEKVGNVLREQGDLAGALEAYREALAVRHRLAEADGTNAGWQRDLSVSFTNMALTLSQAGKRIEAEEFARKSLVIDERLAALDPTNVTWQSDVKVSRALVARLGA